MPQTPHLEKHFTASETVRDIVIGMSDGLTVPFALAAGLAGAVAPEATRLVITAGLAEIAAGSIAMGLGGYLAARTDAEHYASERTREERETVEMPDEEERVRLAVEAEGAARQVIGLRLPPDVHAEELVGVPEQGDAEHLGRLRDDAEKVLSLGRLALE